LKVWGPLSRVLIGMLLRLAPVAMLGAMAFAVHSSLEPMSRDDLAPRRAELRAAAERRAGGEVRGPRLIEGPSAFRMVYRRGQRCRVVVRVDRSAAVFASAGDAPVQVRSRGCRRGAGA
jgi:hypothetical protein